MWRGPLAYGHAGATRTVLRSGSTWWTVSASVGPDLIGSGRRCVRYGARPAVVAHLEMRSSSGHPCLRLDAPTGDLRSPAAISAPRRPIPSTYHKGKLAPRRIAQSFGDLTSRSAQNLLMELGQLAAQSQMALG